MARRSIWYHAFAAALLGGAALPSAVIAQAQPDAAYTVAPERLAGLADFVDGVMAQQIATREVAGAVVTVVHQGRVLFARGYGFADVDKGVAVDAQTTLFRPGSVSKMFTLTAMLQQVDDGPRTFSAHGNE